MSRVEELINQEFEVGEQSRMRLGELTSIKCRRDKLKADFPETSDETLRSFENDLLIAAGYHSLLEDIYKGDHRRSGSERFDFKRIAIRNVLWLGVLRNWDNGIAFSKEVSGYSDNFGMFCRRERKKRPYLGAKDTQMLAKEFAEECERSRSTNALLYHPTPTNPWTN